MRQVSRSGETRRWRSLLIALACAVSLIGGTALAQDLNGELESKKAALESAREDKGVLTSELADLSEQIEQLTEEISVLRNREAEVARELRETEARLRVEAERLEQLRRRLKRALSVLEERLVDIYKSGAPPDALTVLLEADGFDDLVSRYDYLTRIQDQDATVVGRVRDLKDEAQRLVESIRSARDSLAAQEAELERTRLALEAKETALEQARAEQAGALDRVEGSIQRLEGDVSELQERITAQLRAQASTTTSDPQPLGPVQGAGDFIWPIDAVLTSPFGPRWGRLHAGLDLAAPGGTPIRATASGSVAMAQYYGGYGNYTCIDHGGGLSSCYAHQSGFNTNAGASVEQGEVIGYVGTTGNSTGDHLHFEIRLNGTPVDPMGYLG